MDARQGRTGDSPQNAIAAVNYAFRFICQSGGLCAHRTLRLQQAAQPHAALCGQTAVDKRERPELHSASRSPRQRRPTTEPRRRRAFGVHFEVENASGRREMRPPPRTTAEACSTGTRCKEDRSRRYRGRRIDLPGNGLVTEASDGEKKERNGILRKNT